MELYTLPMSITVEDSAVKRIKDLRTQQGKEALCLRLRVEGGGCSGFQYVMDLSEEIGERDKVLAGCVVSDDISLGFLDGATLSFAEELAGSAFKIDNPNAVSGCGCGSSFSVV